MAAPVPKDPITCHVLNTITGKPAAGIEVSLHCLEAENTPGFGAITNSDGRILNWEHASHGHVIASKSEIEELVRTGKSEGALWKLKFETGHYFGQGKTFFPVVELTFMVKAGEHFHVPLLLGPYSFTTYRGS